MFFVCFCAVPLVFCVSFLFCYAYLQSASPPLFVCLFVRSFVCLFVCLSVLIVVVYLFCFVLYITIYIYIYIYGCAYFVCLCFSIMPACV